MSTRGRWSDWKPRTPEPSSLAERPENPAQIFLETAKDEPTKPTKTDFGVFVGSTLANSQKIEAEGQPGVDGAASNTSCGCKPGDIDCTKGAADPTQAQIDASGRVLAQSGMRLMELNGVTTVGFWSDLDSLEVREAITVFHPEGVPVRYLDGDVPMQYKLRRLPGEPVPQDVLAAMQEHVEDEPWVIRDRMLEEMGWTPDGIPWAEWKAASLNKLFEEQGARGEQGRITPETIRHRERGRK